MTTSIDFEFKYIYHGTTKELLRTQEVEYDHTGAEVMYPFETRIEPPEFRDNEIPIFNESLQRWSVVADYRNTEVYVDGKHAKQWRELGPLPSDVQSTRNLEVSSLEEAKDSAIDVILRYRDSARLLGFTYKGKVFDSNQASILVLSAYESDARDSLSNGDEFTPVEWVTKDNTSMTLTADDFVGIMRAYARHVTAVNGHARDLKDAIRGVTIPDGSAPLLEREKLAIDMVMSYDLSFSSVVPEGCDPKEIEQQLFELNTVINV